MTDLHPWVYNLVLVMLGVVTLVWLVWCLKGDRAKGRKRCPRCWYDLGPQATAAVLEGLRRNGWLARVRRARAWKSEAAKGTACGVEPAAGAEAGNAQGGATPAGAFICCPECGTMVTRVRQLKRSRRRSRLALLAIFPVLVGSQVAMFPLRPDRGWTRWVPTTVLMAASGVPGREQREFGSIYVPGAQVITPPGSALLIDPTSPSASMQEALLLRQQTSWPWQAQRLVGSDRLLSVAEVRRCLLAPDLIKRGTRIEVALYPTDSPLRDHCLVDVSVFGVPEGATGRLPYSVNVQGCFVVDSKPERVWVDVDPTEEGAWTLRVRVVATTDLGTEYRTNGVVVRSPRLFLVTLGDVEFEYVYCPTAHNDALLTLSEVRTTKVRLARPD